MLVWRLICSSCSSQRQLLMCGSRSRLLKTYLISVRFESVLFNSLSFQGGLSPQSKHLLSSLSLWWISLVQERRKNVCSRWMLLFPERRNDNPSLAITPCIISLQLLQYVLYLWVIEYKYSNTIIGICCLKGFFFQVFFSARLPNVCGCGIKTDRSHTCTRLLLNL